MVYYYTINASENGTDVSHYQFDLKMIEIHDEDLPTINDNEVLPLNRLEFIENKANEFLRSFEGSLKKKAREANEEFVECLRAEMRNVGARIYNMKNFLIHNILKMKGRQSLLEHRFDEWMIFSIKRRNAIVYDYCNYLKDAIHKVTV